MSASTTGPNGANPDEKRFATLAAQYALAGHALIRCNPKDGAAAFYCARWGFLKPLADLDAAERFLTKIGGEA
jgi:hypothetical protein